MLNSNRITSKTILNRGVISMFFLAIVLNLMISHYIHAVFHTAFLVSLIFRDFFIKRPVDKNVAIAVSSSLKIKKYIPYHLFLVFVFTAYIFFLFWYESTHEGFEFTMVIMKLCLGVLSTVYLVTNLLLDSIGYYIIIDDDTLLVRRIITKNIRVTISEIEEVLLIGKDYSSSIIKTKENNNYRIYLGDIKQNDRLRFVHAIRKNSIPIVTQ